MTVSINGVDKQGVYVNGVQVKQALSADNETVNKGVYDAITLSAVDADLAPGNIKDTVNIFGKVGTFEGVPGTLAEDVKGTVKSTEASNKDSSSTIYRYEIEMTTGVIYDLATLTQTYETGSLTIGIAYIDLFSSQGASCKLRLYMDGVSVAEGAVMEAGYSYILIASRAMAGEDKICKASIIQNDGVSRYASVECERSGRIANSYVAAGSVKLV